MREFLVAYLFGYLFYVGLSLGCLALWMLSQLTGGAWATLTRRIMEASARVLPLLFVMSVPILVGVRVLYPWARPAEVAADHVLQHKQPYLNIPFWVCRTVAYFLIWLILLYFLCRFSAQEDRRDDPKIAHRFRQLSGPGLFIYAITAAWAYIDWAMSILPHWYSTDFGFIVVTDHVLGALSFIILVLAVLAQREPMQHLVSKKTIHDLGKLLLGWVLLWTYAQISQLMISWSGNLPPELAFYLPRWHGGWGWLSFFLIVFHFGVPFVLLLSAHLKQHLWWLSIVAFGLVVMRFAAMFWLVAPDYHPEHFHVSFWDFIIPPLQGFLWLGFFYWQLRRRPLVPRYAPYVEMVLHHEPDRFPR